MFDGEITPIRVFSNANRYGRQGHDRTHRRADRERDETSCQEDTGCQEILWEDRHRQIDGGIYGTHRFCGMGKRTSHDEDQDHQHDVAVGRSSAELPDPLIQLASFRAGYGHNRGQDEGNGDRHLVKIASD